MEDKYIIHISNKIISSNFDDNYIRFIEDNLQKIVIDDMKHMSSFISLEMRDMVINRFDEFKKRVIEYTNTLLKKYWMDFIPITLYKFTETIPDKNEEDENNQHFIKQLVYKEINSDENNVLKQFLLNKKSHIEYYILQFYKRIIRDINDELISVLDKKEKLKKELREFFKGQNILLRNGIEYNKLYKNISKYYRRNHG